MLRTTGSFSPTKSKHPRRLDATDTESRHDTRDPHSRLKASPPQGLPPQQPVGIIRGYKTMVELGRLKQGQVYGVSPLEGFPFVLGEHW